MKRSYGQYCGVARALDLVGERWTILIIRELIVGPQRYKDLLDALPGIGTNLLAARLHELDGSGIVARRTLPRPAASTVYELTPLGRDLEPIVLALGRWGRRFLPPEPNDAVFQSRYLLFALRASFSEAQAAGITESYELHVGDDIVHARVDNGALEVGEGPLDAPDLVIEAPLDTLFAFARGATDPGTNPAAAQLRRRGTLAAVRRFWKIFDSSSLPGARGGKTRDVPAS